MFSMQFMRAAGVALVAGLAAPSISMADDLVSTLPADLQALYVDTAAKIQPSAYDNFKTPAGPWKWCHSESYQGNPWRVAVTNELRRLVEGLGASFEVSDSNGDTAQQINQIRAFIDKGCTVITTIPASETGLNDVIKAAYDAGIPFITAAAEVSSPYAINVESNYAAWAVEMIHAIAKAKGGKADLLMVEGLAGNPGVVQMRAAADKTLAEEKGINLVRSVYGDWTANVTKSAVLQVLATYPGNIDAVWTSGSESRVIAEAFAEAGRKPPLITGSPTGDAVGYWKANPDKYDFTGNGVWPHWTAQALFRVAVRTLDGQQPRLNAIMIPLPKIALSDFEGLYEPCMTADAVSVFPIPRKDPVPEALLDGYFKKPGATRGYDYSTVPAACAK